MGNRSSLVCLERGRHLPWVTQQICELGRRCSRRRRHSETPALAQRMLGYGPIGVVPKWTANRTPPRRRPFGQSLNGSPDPRLVSTLGFG